MTANAHPSSSPPLIGITCSRLTGGAWGLYSLGHFLDYTFSDYSQAVLAAGAAPVLIPTPQSAQSLRRVLAGVQGVILSGGPDVHPRRYGEEPAAGLGEVDEALDGMEIALARLAVDRGVPLLGVCRGIQVLNVALGGSLYQDIASQLPEAICHTPKADKSVLTHTVRIEGGSLLARILRRREIWVNGKHHQAVKEVAPGLRPAAWARDGVIEALEHPGKPFVLGVQWHPEGTFREDPFALKLFRALAAAAGGKPPQAGRGR